MAWRVRNLDVPIKRYSVGWDLRRAGGVRQGNDYDGLAGHPALRALSTWCSRRGCTDNRTSEKRPLAFGGPLPEAVVGIMTPFLAFAPVSGYRRRLDSPVPVRDTARSGLIRVPNDGSWIDEGRPVKLTRRYLFPRDLVDPAPAVSAAATTVAEPSPREWRTLRRRERRVGRGAYWRDRRRCRVTADPAVREQPSDLC